MWPVFPRYIDPLRQWRGLGPDRIAIVDRGRGTRQTYREMDASSDAWALVLRASGVERGDRVAVVAGNRAEVAQLFFACTRIGAALVPLNWRLAPNEVRAIHAHSRSKLPIAESHSYTLQESDTHTY